MNLVGKILTVLILVMSVVFCGLTMAVYATHKNWQEEVMTKLKPRLDDAKAQNEALETKIADLELQKQFEKNDATRAQAALQTKTQVLQGEIDKLDKEKADLDVQLRDNVGAMTANAKELESLRTEVADLRSGIEEANTERYRKVDEVNLLNDRLTNAEMERARLEQRNLDLTADLTKARQVLETAGMSIDDSPFPPEVEGIVTAVSSPDMVEISIGEDDGLRRGHKLEVYRVRGGRHILVGRVEVVEASYDKAACKVDPNFRQSNIERQDRVTSKIR